MNRYAALIPIKDHSERVPGKNFRLLGDKPLWEHIVYTLSGIEEVGAIFINTDSARFTSAVLAPYPKVRIIPRPAALCGDFVPTNALFSHDLSVIGDEYQHFLQTHTTNPLLTRKTIRATMQRFEESLAADTADSLFTVTAYFARFYRRDLTPINHDPRELKRTQDLDPVLEENSNLYLFTREAFAATRARIGRRPFLFEMDRLEATDIDDQASWDLAAALLELRTRTGDWR